VCKKLLEKILSFLREIFTEEEIENARIYIQEKFTKTFPERQPCSQLHVRKDVKCLTKNEMHDFVAIMKQLYANGVIDR
jgi:hypothetical protein